MLDYIRMHTEVCRSSWQWSNFLRGCKLYSRRKKFETTEQSIRNKLTSVLKEVGGKLKPSPRYVGLIQEEIMKYLKNNNCVTYDEVVDYILKEKRINIIGRKIRNTLCMIVRKSGGEYSICSKKNNCNK